MYNRYIPQPDGSFRRSLSPDRAPARQAPPHRPERNPEPVKEAPHPPQEEKTEPQRPVPTEEPHRERQEPSCSARGHQGQSIIQFFRQLLPKDFDTTDLLIVLLLLLMAGDSQEDQNHALLTLALYLFM